MDKEKDKQKDMGKDIISQDTSGYYFGATELPDGRGWLLPGATRPGHIDWTLGSKRVGAGRISLIQRTCGLDGSVPHKVLLQHSRPVHCVLAVAQDES